MIERHAPQPASSPEPATTPGTTAAPVAAPGVGPRAGARRSPYATGAYWEARSDLLYYDYFRFIVRCIGSDARSMADVGSGNCPYLDWFHWIPERVSIDIRKPYTSEAVRGVQGDILALDFPRRFDVVTCLQVMEHLKAPEPFARRLLELGRLVLVSVPYKWPKGATRGHVNDPVDLQLVERWFGRPANHHLRVREPFMAKKGERLFAIFDTEDPARRFGSKDRENRRPAAAGGATGRATMPPRG